MRILVIEDNPLIARAIKRGLEQAQFEVDVAVDGVEGLEMASRGQYVLLILDLMLPRLDGWSVCQALREKQNPLPILMLTARGELGDKVRGFEMGADDYLSKPFEFLELLARARSLIRRDKVHRTRVIQIDDLEIDSAQHTVTRGSEKLELSSREFRLLEALASSEGRVLSRDVIQERVWMSEECSSNTVDVYIGLLRKKIDSGRAVKLIHTVRGAGYSLRRP